MKGNFRTIRNWAAATAAAALFTLGLSGTAEAAGNAGQPPICVRSCWGAQSSSYNTNMAALNRAIIHHTAGAGDYNISNFSQATAKVRAIQNLHIGNGWGDIGYHFLVDKLGNAFEGRLGSMDKNTQRRGAHDATNTNSFGFNFPGYYHPPYNNALTTVQKNLMYDLIAWRMPNGWSPYGSGTYNGNNVGWLDGHRDVKSTACPGDLIYNTIIGTNHSAGEARAEIWNRINGAPPPPPLPTGTPVTTLAGWYRMIGKNSGKVIDVAGAGTASGTDVIQYDWTGNAAQVWLFEHLGDGYYKISAKHSGKVLDAAGCGGSGANIHQWDWADNDCQKFRVYDMGAGEFRFERKGTTAVLDVAGCGTANGTSIILYNWSNNDCQKFYVESVPVPVTNLSGDYRLIAKHSRKMLDVAGSGQADGTNVAQYHGNAGDAQVWNLTHVGNGYYSLRSRVNSKMLDVSWGSTADGATVWTWTDNGGTAQRWRIEDLGDGYHRLVAQHSGKVLDVAGANAADGADVIQYAWTGNNAQRWEVERVGQPVTNLSGNKRVVSRVSGKVLDVAGGSTADGADVIQYTWTGNPAQIWSFTHLGSGFYSLTAQVSGKVLDVAGAGTANGTDVIQYTWTNSDAQKWRVETMPDGSVRLVSAVSGIVLDVAGGSTADGADVITWEYTGALAQQWDIYSVP